MSQSSATLTREETVQQIADELLQRMVDGELCPEEATEALAHLAGDAAVWPDLCGFHHLLFEWDAADRAHEDCDALRGEMLAEAERLLAAGGLSGG